MKRRLLISLIGIVVVSIGGLAANIGLGNKPRLGLDLQGGASVTLRPASGQNVDTDSLKEVAALYRQRIESFNIQEAEVIRQGDTIVVNLPGVKDQTRAIELIGTTGKVTFRPVLIRQGGFHDLSPPISGTTLAPPTTQPESLVTVSSTTVPASTDAVSEGSTTTAAGGPSRRPQQDTGTTTTIATTSAAPTTVPASTVAGETTTTVAGETTTTAAFDPSSVLTPTEQDLPDATVILTDRDGASIYQLGPVFALGEEAVDTAEAQIDNSTGYWQVSLTLKSGDGGLGAWNTAAAQCFAKADSCKDGGMAIIIDHRVISAPVPQISHFDSPNVSITGNFGSSEAKQLARVLKYGATPVEMQQEAVQTVSATIGDDSLRAGIVSGLIGVGLVLLLMALYYRRLAIVVFGGILLSAALLWSTIVVFDEFFVLTLAGVTGIIVSIGVTVDSYVVFFERLKDEVRSGRTLRNSVQRGFASAWRTILAADFVSLLGALVLWYLSVGSVRGFALFLGLSTVCDIVVAWFFLRPSVILLARRPSFQNDSIFQFGPPPVAVSTVPGGVA